jgi:hypothetical protein
VAPLALKFALLPTQIVALLAVMVGSGLTVTVITDKAEQVPLLPVIVYVVVTVGVAVTVLPDVELRPVPGLHVYVLAPLAVSTALLPRQMAGGVAVTVGVTPTLTVAVVVFTQLVTLLVPLIV